MISILKCVYYYEGGGEKQRRCGEVGQGNKNANEVPDGRYGCNCSLLLELLGVEAVKSSIDDFTYGRPSVGGGNVFPTSERTLSFLVLF